MPINYLFFSLFIVHHLYMWYDANLQCLHLQVIAYQNSGMKLGILKSANESLTRVVVYISLLALYSLGGSKVKTVRAFISCVNISRLKFFCGRTFCNGKKLLNIHFSECCPLSSQSVYMPFAVSTSNKPDFT